MIKLNAHKYDNGSGGTDWTEYIPARDVHTISDYHGSKRAVKTHDGHSYIVYNTAEDLLSQIAAELSLPAPKPEHSEEEVGGWADERGFTIATKKTNGETLLYMIHCDDLTALFHEFKDLRRGHA